MVHNLPWMHKEGWSSFWQHHLAPYCPHHAISVKVISQISHKIQDLGYLIKKGNGMLRYKEGYILLLNWSIAFLICIINVGGTSDSICKPLMCQILLFLYQCWLSNCIQNIVIFGVPSRHRKWDVMLQGEISKLILKCVITFLIWIMDVEGSSDSTYKSLIDQGMPFLLMLPLKLHTKG